MLSTTDETQDYRKAFQAYYYEKMQNDLATFESKRRSVLIKYRLLQVLFILNCCYFVFLIYNPLSSPESILSRCIFAITTVLFLLPFYVGKVLKKDFEKKVKQKVIKSFLSFFGDFKWSMKQHLSQSLLESSGLTGHIDRIESDDYFKGSFNNIGITISEMTLIREMLVSFIRHDEIKFFKGIFIKLDLTKEISSHTIIIENLSLCPKLFTQLPVIFPGLEKIKLEDPDFNRQFDVFSNNQTEARFLLTTTFMERFKHLKEIFNTNHIRASFQNNSVLIAISSNKDLFVLGNITKPVTDTQEVQTLFEEFAAVLSLIEVLKLNIKTGL